MGVEDCRTQKGAPLRADILRISKLPGAGGEHRFVLLMMCVCVKSLQQQRERGEERGRGQFRGCESAWVMNKREKYRRWRGPRGAPSKQDFLTTTTTTTPARQSSRLPRPKEWNQDLSSVTLSPAICGLLLPTSFLGHSFHRATTGDEVARSWRETKWRGIYLVSGRGFGRGGGRRLSLIMNHLSQRIRPTRIRHHRHKPVVVGGVH